jgi:hypothetical protein
MNPTKENTLYLPIKQVYFDAIISGTKNREYREIKIRANLYAFWTIVYHLGEVVELKLKGE